MNELLNAVQIELFIITMSIVVDVGWYEGALSKGNPENHIPEAGATRDGCPGRNLFLEERLEEGKDIRGDDFVAVGGGMGVVPLHHSLHAEDAL